VPGRCAFEYAIVRVVPEVAREELVNAGAIVLCHDRAFLAAQVEIDDALVLALWPRIDLEVVRDHLLAIPRICAGGPAAGLIGDLPLRDRFQWLVAPRNTVVQTSRPHAGMTDDPGAALERLMDTMVRRARA
jgi:hypothetical protein